MHNPKLKQRLHRVRVPTLLIWGEHDGIVTPDYGEAFSQMIPQAKFAIVEQAGHYPHLEQPSRFSERSLREFLWLIAHRISSTEQEEPEWTLGTSPKCPIRICRRSTR